MDVLPILRRGAREDMISPKLTALDADLRAILEARERALDAIVHLAQKYRGILRPELRRLGAGAHPAPIRCWHS